jgi:hypothetical protein
LGLNPVPGFGQLLRKLPPAQGRILSNKFLDELDFLDGDIFAAVAQNAIHAAILGMESRNASIFSCRDARSTRSDAPPHRSRFCRDRIAIPKQQLQLMSIEHQG